MNVNRTNKVISIEGGEGSGKTTVIQALEQWFKSNQLECMITREPGGVRIAEAIREVILDVSHTEMDPRTEALLYAAARRQHLTEKVLPAIEAGKWIVMDRFVDSSVVYQGYVRGIGMEAVEALNHFATEGFLPDLTLYLDIEPEIGLKRVLSNDGREVNRLDLEGLAFHNKVREGYQLLAKSNPNRFVVIDAHGTQEQVLAEVCKHLERFL